MVLRVYFDASRTEDPDAIPIAATGGHIGDEKAWSDVEGKWQVALDYWQLERFHLHDLPDILGHEKAQLCIRNFARIIDESELLGISSGINHADWNQLVAQEADYQNEFPTTQHFTLDMVLGVLDQQLGPNLPDEHTLVIADADYGSGEEAARAIHAKWAAKNKNIGPLAILSHPHNKIIPLQMADLYVGLRRRDWAKRGLDGEPDTPNPVVTHDTRALWRAGGRGSYGSMWSWEIARKISEIKRARDASAPPSEKSS